MKKFNQNGCAVHNVALNTMNRTIAGEDNEDSKFQKIEHTELNSRKVSNNTQEATV